MLVMAEIVALGCGLVGEYVISKLIDDGHDLTVIGLEIPEKLQGKCITKITDALEFVKKIEGSPLIINMLPGQIGNSVREILLNKKLDVVDLAFTIEDPRKYDNLAKNNNCKLVYDVGIAPGYSNLLIAKAIEEIGDLETCKIRVGGIPSKPDENWSYMAPFSPSDVIEEYERPARIIDNFEYVEVPAISDLHTIDYENIVNEGTISLQAFMTDGLRSLLDYGSCKNMSEYTLRWPGHIEKFVEIQKQGLLKGDKRAETISKLITEWKYIREKPEFTILDVITENNTTKKRWIVFDNGSEKASSMARTTGLVTLGFIDEMLEGNIPDGVFAPEELHKIKGLTNRITKKLTDEGVKITELL